MHFKTNSAQPCISTVIDTDPPIIPKSFPLHTSLPLHEPTFKFLPGSALARSDMLADIVVFSGFRLKKARYISPEEAK